MKSKALASTSKYSYPVRRFFGWLKTVVFENKKMKFLSLGLAVLLFIVSRQPQRDVMLVGVPLEFINTPPGLEISTEVPNSVQLRLRGAQDVVRDITPNELEVKADLSDKAAGDRVIQLKPTDVIKPDKVEVRRIEPGTIEIKLEPTKRKVVPIEAQFSGHLAENYERTGVRLEPATIEIEGPESRVAEVQKLLTESVQLNDKRASFHLNVDLEANRQGVRLVKPGQIKLTIEVSRGKNVE